MSSLWGEVLSPYGEFISKTYYINSGHTSLFATVELEYENNFNQRIDYFYSYSQDGNTWVDWQPLNSGIHNLFAGVDTTEIYIRFKVILESKLLSESPEHKGIKLTLYPYEYIFNNGDLKACPKLWVKKINGSGDIQIINKTNEQTLSLTNLHDDEEVFIDTYDETIISSLQSSLNIYRYDDHNNVWLNLEAGDNYLDSKGDFLLDIRYYAPLLQD